MKTDKTKTGLAVLLLLSVVIAYLPSLSGGLLWDDAGHITTSALQSFHGLYRIWFEVGATQQYYPLLHTAFWIEHRIWGDAPLYYRLTNIALHCVSAFLLVAIMRRLKIPGGWLAAFLFALHPVSTESVAWISEQKNTLSTAFYLASALCYLNFDRDRRRQGYFLALAFYVMAVLSKSVTATLPATLLVVLWWEHKKLDWRRDVQPLLPWFGLGIAAGILTAWFEYTYIGAKGTEFALGIGERLLLPGRVVLFYLGKLFWPSNLSFIYPRWAVDTGVAWQYLFPIALLSLAAGLWLLRRKSPTPFAAFLCFVIALAPALGFINVYPFRYSFVADHFQYQASLIVFIAVAAGLTTVIAKFRYPALLAALPVVALGGVTYSQAAVYHDEETLYRATIARNPECWMAYNNLGIVYSLQPARAPEAVALFRKALEIRPDFADVHFNLGNVLLDTGKLPEAIAEYRIAIRSEPNMENAHYSLGNALSSTPGGASEAIEEYRTAIRLKPDDARAHSYLGALLAEMPERIPEAIAEYRRAIGIDPNQPEPHFNLANGLLRSPGHLEEAIGEYLTALRLRPGYAQAHLNLATALLQTPDGRDKAIAEFRQAIRAQAKYPQAHYNLAMVLADVPGGAAESIVEFQAAIRDDPNYTDAHCNLGVMLMDTPGRLSDALAQFEAAVRSKPGLQEGQCGWGPALARGRGTDAGARFIALLRH